MTSAVPAARYTRLSIALHWLMAALIVAAFALGLTVDLFPASLKRLVVETHKDIGVAILVLLVVRFAWRLAEPPPAPDPTLGRTSERLAGLAHGALYVLMLAVPVIGIVYVFWRGQGLSFGLFDIASPFAADRPTARQFREIHEWAAYALLGLAGLHAAAALWHHAVRRDGVLRRMLPA